MVMNGRYAVLFEKDNLFKKFMPLLWTKITPFSHPIKEIKHFRKPESA